MCGIHGHIKLDFAISQAQCGFIRDGFVAGSLRGMDSSGIFQLDRKFKAYTHKKAIAGPDFAFTKMTERYIRDVDSSRATICHLRHATMGKVEEDNAHPFEVEKADGNWIVGVHNGTLTNWKFKEGAKDFDVDSNWALSHIADKGVDAFKDFTGAFCFIWWDGAQKDKLFMCRNKERPMHFRLSTDGSQMFFASEAGMLAWLTERNDCKVSKEVYTLETEQVYEFDMSKQKVEWKKTPMPKPAVYNYVAPAAKAATPTTVIKATPGAVADGVMMTRFLAGIKKAAAGARDVLALELAENNGKKRDGTMSKEEKEEARLVIDDADDTVVDRRPADVPFALTPLAKATSSPLDLSDLDDLGVSHPLKQKEEPRTESATEKVIRETEEAMAPLFDDTNPTTGTTGCSAEDMSSEWIAPASWFDASSAKPNEQTTAKFYNSFGEIQWFEGTTYDPDEGTVMGEVREYVSGEGHINHAAMIRGISAPTASRRYINNRSKTARRAGNWAVVVGINEDPILGKYLIMAELTDQAMAELLKKVN